MNIFDCRMRFRELERKMLGLPERMAALHQTESRLPFSHPVAKSVRYDCDAATGGVVEWLMAPVLKF